MVLACISSSHVGTTLTAKRASSSDETTTVCLKIMLLLFLHQCGHQECKCYCYCCTISGIKIVIVATMLASRILVLLLLLHQFWHQNCNCCTNVGIKNISFGVIVVPLLTSRMLMLLLLFTISGIKIVIVATMLASTILVLLLLLHQFWHQNCYCCTNVGIKNISVGVCSGGVDLPLVNSSARYEHGHRRVMQMAVEQGFHYFIHLPVLLFHQ